MFFSFRAGVAACAVALASLVSLPQGLAAERLPQRLTVQQAVEEAFARSPVLRARRAEVDQAEGRLRTAKIYPLDPELTVDIMDLVASAALRGTTVVVATHELGLVSRYGKRAVRLEGGRVAEDHRPAGFVS